MNPIKRLLIAILIACVLTLAATAQIKKIEEDHDAIKVTLAFQNLNVANTNLPGVNASGDYRIAKFGEWRLGAVADFAYQRDSNRVVDRYQFLGGPQLSYNLAKGRLNLFGRGLFGATRFEAVGQGFHFNRMTVGAGGGLDINVGEYFYIRPAQFDFQFINQRPVRYTRFAFGAGFKY